MTFLFIFHSGLQQATKQSHMRSNLIDTKTMAPHFSGKESIIKRVGIITKNEGWQKTLIKKDLLGQSKKLN